MRREEPRLAAHVRAAMSTVQAKMGASVEREPAPHVHRAVAAVQAILAVQRGPGNAASIQCAALPVNNQSTSVTLRITGAPGSPYQGKSSGEQGHAEMDALNKFIKACEAAGLNPGTVLGAAASKTVQCEAKPVCVACSRALSSLGIGPYSAATEFGDEKSGGVSWGAGLKVRAFLGQDVYEECVKLGAK